MQSSIWSEGVRKDGNEFEQGRQWLFIAKPNPYAQTRNWTRPDISLGKVKLTRQSTGVEVAFRARIWTWMSRPPTGSDDPCDWQTNWSRGLVRVGETKSETLLSGVEVLGTALSGCSPEKALDRQTNRRG
ncbi:hypothetical protein L1987_13297 [Smallanthus sonchifolius]|uniref:Uncharacterized protein n=1 Tax=Smallanthus sonchifolius TaxID=185202 RepID=A0ACB9JI73_9ASTR|nr:hypothetical protein L1987_13297 [Smallanthus sonchifolius]